MNKNIIKMYAYKITKDDIVNFAQKENVNITENETNIILNAIKNDIDILLSENAIIYLESYKGKISDNLYKKLEDLYYKYEKFTK